MISPLSLKDLPAVVRLHKENLPSLMAVFPLKFIQNFYEFQLSRPGQLLLGYFADDTLLGFIVGTDDVEKLYDDFIKKNKRYFYFQTMKAFIQQPKFLWPLLFNLFSKPYKSACKRQIVYLVVDEKAGKKGVGSALMTEVRKQWSDVGYYELEVDAKNPAVRFYLKNGFLIVHEWNYIFEKKLLMGITLK